MSTKAKVKPYPKNHTVRCSDTLQQAYYNICHWFRQGYPTFHILVLRNTWEIMRHQVTTSGKVHGIRYGVATSGRSSRVWIKRSQLMRISLVRIICIVTSWSCKALPCGNQSQYSRAPNDLPPGGRCPQHLTKQKVLGNPWIQQSTIQVVNWVPSWLSQIEEM